MFSKSQNSARLVVSAAVGMASVFRSARSEATDCDRTLLRRRRVFGSSARFPRRARAQEGRVLDVADHQPRLVRIADPAPDEDAQCRADMLGQGADDHHAVVAAVEGGRNFFSFLLPGAEAPPP